jgi:hypothetical protein
MWALHGKKANGNKLVSRRKNSATRTEMRYRAQHFSGSSKLWTDEAGRKRLRRFEKRPNFAQNCPNLVEKISWLVTSAASCCIKNPKQQTRERERGKLEVVPTQVRLTPQLCWCKFRLKCGLGDNNYVPVQMLCTEQAQTDEAIISCSYNCN